MKAGKGAKCSKSLALPSGQAPAAYVVGIKAILAVQRHLGSLKRHAGKNMLETLARLNFRRLLPQSISISS